MQHSISGRQVRVIAYSVLEGEVHILGLCNTLMVGCFTVASSLASIAIGVWVNAVFSEGFTPEGGILIKVVAPALCILAAGILVGGLWARSRQMATWNHIKRSNGAIAQDGANAHDEAKDLNQAVSFLGELTDKRAARVSGAN
jgi:hypothetical protein